MNSFERKQDLVADLVSNHEPTFLKALQQAVTLSERGDYEGVRAIREAIRIRSGKKTVSFYKPGVRTGSGDMLLNRYAQAQEKILGLVKKDALLKDPAFSGEWITALMLSLDGFALQNLVREIFQLGGLKAGFEFQLLYNELRSSAKWN